MTFADDERSFQAKMCAPMTEPIQPGAEGATDGGEQAAIDWATRQLNRCNCKYTASQFCPDCNAARVLKRIYSELADTLHAIRVTDAESIKTLTARIDHLKASHVEEMEGPLQAFGLLSTLAPHVVMGPKSKDEFIATAKAIHEYVTACLAEKLNQQDQLAALRQRLAEVEPKKDVHTEHCCLRHGCKYMDEACTVTTKQLKQSFPCEYCPEDAIEEAIETIQIEVDKLRTALKKED